jgi:hypothetical protein
MTGQSPTCELNFMLRALAATRLLQVHPKECRYAAGKPAIHAPLSDGIQSYPQVAGQR